MEYLRILHLAASTIEADVEHALTTLLALGTPITCDAVRATCGVDASAPSVPDLAAPPIDLASYDVLLTEAAS